MTFTIRQRLHADSPLATPRYWTAESLNELGEREYEDLDERIPVLCRDGEVRLLDEVEPIYGPDWALVGFDPR